MNYSKINPCDIANGTGCRVSLFVSGCTKRCKGCFQPETWDFAHGEPFTESTIEKIAELLSKPYIRGLTLLGGDPMEPQNQIALLPLVKRVKRFYPDKDIWCYTGATLEELLDAGDHSRRAVTGDLLSYLDVLVDGRYREDLRDPSLWFRGSSNQRIIDVPETLRRGSIVLLQDRDRNHV